MQTIELGGSSWIGRHDFWLALRDCFGALSPAAAAIYRQHRGEVS